MSVEQNEEGGQVSDKDLKGVGLVSDHAYSVISAYEVDHKGGQKLRLLKLRNPWGHQEWTGDWSDESPKWTAELRTKLKFTEA